MAFVGLHIHTDYSLLDGASQINQLVDEAVKLGMPGIAITDHGVMYGAIELIKQCRSKNIKPIIGNEMYLINGDITKQEKRPKYHQLVLAKNTEGYKNLVKLTSISHLEGMQGKGIVARPCINKELLAQHKEGLIVTSACIGGEIPQLIMSQKSDKARETAAWYQETFQDDYYLEIQDHGYQDERIVNIELVKISQELGIKIIATNDSHYISCYDVEAHDALLCIQTGQLITNENRMRYSGTEYLKNQTEMKQLFRDHLSDDIIEQAINNTQEICDKISTYHNIIGEPRLPQYPKIPPNETAESFLESIARQNLVKRLKLSNFTEVEPNYKERLNLELKVIQEKGFATYFLVVWDFIDHARKNHIPVGPGRGSAAGSLVAYCLGITNIDPVHHGLLFERFLNPERKSMPDIDTDFCIDNRDTMIKYVTETYGQNNVAQIITFNRMTSKAVLKDVARVLDIPYAQADKMAKMIPVSRGKPAKLKEMISEQSPTPEFRELYQTQELTKRWIDLAMRIEGTNKTFGVHAAGVVISSEPLTDIVPLQKNNDGAVITQYFMEDLESVGLLKMDFLGLKNLTMIKQTIDLIKEHRHITIDPDEITLQERKAQHIKKKGEIKTFPKEVEATYNLISQGLLEGVFQLESSGMRQIVRELKPNSIEDLSSILALYRPGPLDAGLIPQFINRKHGREPITYDDPKLKPILEETYGILCYQEQIMKVAQDLAGYSLGQADLLRRAMGKKKPEEMKKQQEQFKDGAAKNGIKPSVADKLFDQMLNFAEYCFNKSHSTAYAYVTYQTAYLKANYKEEYMAALLSSNADDQDKIKKYIDACTRMNIIVEPPDINRSGENFTPNQNKILFGLSAIRNLGQEAVKNILIARNEVKFTSLADLCDRINLQSLNRRSLESLIYCGALDSLNPNRQQMINDLPLIIEWAQNRKKEKAIGQGNLFDLLGSNSHNTNNKNHDSFQLAPKAPPTPDYSPMEKLNLEKQLLGFYISDHPLKQAQKINQILELIPLINLGNHQNQNITALIMVNEIKTVTTKKGDPMAIIQIEDLTSQTEAVIFPKIYEQNSQKITKDERLIIWGKVETKDEQYQIITDLVEPIDHFKIIVIDFTIADLQTDDRIKQLKTLLLNKSNKPKIPVIGRISLGPQQEYICFGQNYWTIDINSTYDKLKSSNFNLELLKLQELYPYIP